MNHPGTGIGEHCYLHTYVTRGYAEKLAEELRDNHIKCNKNTNLHLDSSDYSIEKLVFELALYPGCGDAILIPAALLII